MIAGALFAALCASDVAVSAVLADDADSETKAASPAGSGDKSAPKAAAPNAKSEPEGDFAKPAAEPAASPAGDKDSDGDESMPADGSDMSNESSDGEEGEPGPGVVTPTQEKPAEFAINKPLTSDEAWKQWHDGAKRSDYNNRIHNGELDKDSRDIISGGLKQQVRALTLPSQRQSLDTIVATIVRSIRASAIQKSPGEQRQFREFLLKETVDACRELIDNQYYVRLNAAILLGSLYSVDPTPGVRGSGEISMGSFDPLMEVLQYPNQPEGVKLVAVNGLRHIASQRSPELAPSQRIRLATALIAELEKSATSEWYQQRLCETLASVDQLLDLNGTPFIVQALGKAMFDRNRGFCARAAAARAIGRVPLSPSIDLNVLAYGVADLSRQIAEARNDKKRTVRRGCIMNLLWAFKPMSAYENARHAGLLARVDETSFQKYKKTVNEVYEIIRPIIVHELNEPNADFPPSVIQPAVAWLKSNTPSELRIAPGLPPIATQQITKVESNR